MRPQTLAEAITSGWGTERSFLCPEHADSRPSASVNVLKMVWVCYTCGARGKVGGEQMLGEISWRSLRNYIKTKTSIPSKKTEAWLNQYDAGEVHPYWLGRFEANTCRRHRLGYDLGTGRATYVLRGTDGTPLGVVGRALGGAQPKYKYPLGVDISKLLYGYTPVRRRTVVLVEGAMDAIALDEAGVPALAIYGSRFSDTQRGLILKLAPSQIVTCFDMDQAGWLAHLAVKQAFQLPVERAMFDAKDVAELSIDQRVGVVSDALARIESKPC